MKKNRISDDEKRLLMLLKPLLRFRAVISVVIVASMLAITIINEHVSWLLFSAVLVFLGLANYLSFLFVKKEFSVKLLLIMNGTIFTFLMTIGVYYTGGYGSPFLPGYILLIITTAVLANSWLITLLQTLLVIMAADMVIFLEMFGLIHCKPFFLNIHFFVFGEKDPLYSVFLWNILYAASGALIGAISMVLSRVRSELQTVNSENTHLQNIVKSLVSRTTWKEASAAAKLSQEKLFEHRDEMTILFTDIVGFSTIAENIVPEEVVAMLNLHFQQMGEIIYNNDGDIDKFIGDSVMAVFVDPDKALKAAVEMQKAIKENMKKNSHDDPLAKIQIRIGINTGDVVFGNMGMKERTERSLIGDAVNVAQRLESMATPGYILISQATYQYVKRSGFKFVAVGRVKIKGKKEIIRAYSLNPDKN